MVMLIADCCHGNAVSVRSVQLVSNGNRSVTETVGDERVRRGCRAVSHDMLWRRLDLGITPGSATKQTSLDGLGKDEEAGGDVWTTLVARQTCTPVKHDQRRHRRRRLRRAMHLCHVEKCRLRMREDVFPPYVDSGRCAGASTCLFGLYECVPRRHTVKLLRRLPPDEAHGCLPLPTVSSDAVYEDVWVPFNFQVTVACECSRRRDSGIYSD